jgi:hypothetical protein
MSAATGHGKTVVVKFAVQPGLDHLIQVTGHKRYYLDSVRHDHLLQRPGYGAAYQSCNTQLCQVDNLSHSQAILQKLFRLADNPAGITFHDTDLS